MDAFKSEYDGHAIGRTKSEIFYNSCGTKIETRDQDGNQIQRFDSINADPALNNICSLVQDISVPSKE